ncbi:Kinesin- protein 11 [Datura stramonium]|uniref:Kinesin- protein 11 n=1 Tax=Datura stramonium TaxID=4076 RepID=A0ABS8WM32_DATST|nr:Kinesin- protein 11 [Datura stramonium]
MDVRGYFFQSVLLSSTLPSLNLPAYKCSLSEDFMMLMLYSTGSRCGNIRELGVKINAFVRQEQQYQTRRYQEIQLTSEVLLNLFKTLNSLIMTLRLMDEKSQTVNDQQLCTLEEKKSLRSWLQVKKSN